jgi:pyruvate/2-oxoglutarate dehydrogenase complex dihydrolipoamide acyltransferase (E2) component
MAETFTMPKYGMTMEEGTVTRWLKAEGDPVEKGEFLVEIMADKAEMEVESYLEGVLLRILIPEGETVPCGTPLCWIGEAGEVPPA